MAHHNKIPYKKKAASEITNRTIFDVTAAEQTEIDNIISRFITKFKAKHLS